MLSAVAPDGRVVRPRTPGVSINNHRVGASAGGAGGVGLTTP
jgi:hypothetical protein